MTLEADARLADERVMRRRLLVWIGCLLACLLAAPPLWIVVHLRDLPEPGDVALTLGPPPQDDASEELEKVARSLHWPDGADERWRPLRDGRAQDPEWVRSMLRENEAAFEALDRVLAGPDLQIPVGNHADIMRNSDSYLPVQQLAKLAVAEGWMLLRIGDQRAAFDRALLGMRAGRKISEAYGANLLTLIFAAAPQGVSLYALEQMVRESSLDRDDARALAAALAAQRWDRTAWERVWAAEYQFLAVSLPDVEDFMATEPTNPLGEDSLAARILTWMPWDYAWQPNRTRSGLASRYLELRRRASLDCRPSIEEQSTRTEFSEQMPLRALLLPNPLGRRFAELTISHGGRLDLKRCHLETRVGLVQAQIALRAFSAVEGSLPESLAELVPEYLESIPADRFDGAPIRYSREKGIVYSVGEDGIDAGGSDPPMQTQASEPTIRVAF